MNTTPRILEDLGTTKRVQGSLPANLDPAAHPIIARHFFGVEPFCPTGTVAVKVITRLRRERQIEHVYRLGVRAVAEMLFEVAGGEDLDRALEAYGRLTPDLLKALGGDQFPPAPLHEVRRTL